MAIKRTAKERDELVERLKPTPRRLPFSLQVHNFARGDGTNFLLVGLIILHFALSFRLEEAFVDVFLIDEDATVQGEVTEHRWPNLSVNERDVVELHFKYTVDGIEYNSYSFSSTYRPREGTKVTVEYNPENPRQARIRDTDFSLYWSFNFIVFCVALVPLLIGIYRMRNIPRLGRILRDGPVVNAKVKNAPRIGEVNGRPILNYTFTYEDHHGRQHEYLKTTSTLDGSKAMRPLLYDVRKTDRAVLVDLLKFDGEIQRAGEWNAPTVKQLTSSLIKIAILLLLVLWAMYRVIDWSIWAS